MTAVVLALSDGAWGVISVLIVQLTGLVVLLIKMSRTQREVSQVNRAVNHVKPGAPTLIERVAALEREQARHRDWTYDSMCAIAHQLGVKLPPPPDNEPLWRHHNDQE